MRSNVSEAWHDEQCWDISMNIAESDTGPGKPLTRADHDKIALQLNSVLYEFRFLK